jgi:hypothetical protein
MLILRLVLVVAILIAANVLTLAAPRSMAAARVGGEAYGLAVGSPAVGVPGAAYVQLPPEGGSVADSSPGAGYGVGNEVGSASRIETSSSGDPGIGTVTSTTTVADGELLGGVVRAHDVRIVATASGARPSASVTFGSLIVAGIAYPNPRPNTRIDVPGVGIVIVNEQLVGGDGRDVSAIVVRAVRLQITEPSLFDLPGGTDLILAHAAAGVPDVVANRPVPSGQAPTSTPVPWAPITAYRPINVSLGNGNGDENDNFDIDNGNENGTTTAAATGGTGGFGGTPGTPGTGTPVRIVITVVVVQGTNTPTPTLTPTLTPTPTKVP